MFQKVRYGWALVLDGKVIAHRVTSTARGDILLIASGVVAAFEKMNMPLTVEGKLAFILRERGLTP